MSGIRTGEWWWCRAAALSDEDTPRHRPALVRATGGPGVDVELENGHNTRVDPARLSAPCAAEEFMPGVWNEMQRRAAEVAGGEEATP